MINAIKCFTGPLRMEVSNGCISTSSDVCRHYTRTEWTGVCTGAIDETVATWPPQRTYPLLVCDSERFEDAVVSALKATERRGGPGVCF